MSQSLVELVNSLVLYENQYYNQLKQLANYVETATISDLLSLDYSTIKYIWDNIHDCLPQGSFKRQLFALYCKKELEQSKNDSLTSPLL